MKTKHSKAERYYSQDELTSIKDNLSTVLAKYDRVLVQEGALRRLSDAYSGIFQLLLQNTISLQNAFYYRTITSQTYNPYNSLGPLYNKLKRHKSEPIEIKFNFPNSALTIKNEKVSRWIMEKLLHEIDTWNLPSDFGLLRFLAQANDDKEALRYLKKKAEVKPLPRGRAIYYFCESIIAYLKDKITLDQSNPKRLTYPQLNFCYELMLIVRIETIEGYDFKKDTPPTSKIQTLDRSFQQHRAKALRDRLNTAKD